MTYKTPGVYVEEVSVFPPSVAEVETAIPAFIGYTERAAKNGENLRNRPTKIKSLLEYDTYFGGGFEITTANIEVDPNNDFAVNSVDFPTNYHLYESLRLYFDNGGGDCYIVSVGSYTDPIVIGNENAPGSIGLRVGVRAVEQFDEPTILLFPDAIELADEAQFYGLQQMALAQCNNLQDRVAVLDLKENVGWEDSVTNFRNGIGINNLKYGAVYTPFLRTSYPQNVPFSMFSGSVEDLANIPIDLSTLTTDQDINALVTRVNETIADQTIFESAIDAIDGTVDGRDTIGDVYRGLRDALRTGDIATSPVNLNAIIELLFDVVSESVTLLTTLQNSNLINDLNAYASNSFGIAAGNLIALEKNAGIAAILGAAPFNRDPVVLYNILDATGWLGGNPPLTSATVPASLPSLAGGDDLETSLNAMGDIDQIFSEFMGFLSSIRAAAQTHVDNSTNTLYQTHTIIGNIVNHIKTEMSTAPPSGAVAGLYAFVDDNRGVHKAPANVSVSSVMEPRQVIDDNLQEGLNVDVNAGKSINAIRSFTGKGTLVWGARTLAGNDNEWRYVPVRRFFNMVEESIKKSTGWAVFEPNDANTWSLVKGMIFNYLYDKWQDGALQGATPDEAFFVHIGEGITFTSAEKLQGIMRVKIGMAAVRPAEFIVLEFSHKMVGT